MDASDGGPAVVLERLAQGLREAGLNVHVATTREHGFYKYSRPLAQWLDKHVRDFDLVHVHGLFSHAPIAAARAARRHGVPYVVRPLGSLNAWGMQNRRPLLKKLSFRFIESDILRHAAFVHFASDAERADAEALGVPFRSVVIPNPLPEIPPGKVERDPATVLFLSRLDPIKGIDLLLPAFEQVRQRIPEARLVVAGSGKHPLPDRTNEAISWPGFLQNEAKLEALHRATVFVLPSYSESFGVAAAEAMAAGCPVIVSDRVAIHREITEAGAGLVVPCEIPALANALETLLTNPDLRKQLTARAQHLAHERYGLQSVVSRLIEAYNAFTNGPNTSDPVAVTSTSSSIRKPPTGL